MSIPSHVSLVVPWKRVEGAEEEALSSELERELAANHVLAGLKLAICGRRLDRDDVLVVIENTSKPLAVVHLTWRREKETDPRWPRTIFFPSWADWIENEMQPAHRELTAKC